MTTQLTQGQWYDKIKTFAQRFVWEKPVAQAYAQALAKAASTAQGVVDAHVGDTFLSKAAAGVLDAHGLERSVTRLTDEVDPDFSVRARNLFNQSNIPALSGQIDKILVAGKTRIQEDFNSVPFASRDIYASRAALFLNDPLVNVFSIIVDRQVHAPFSYLDREYFTDRSEAFAGTSESLDRVFTLILKIADDNKALGTVYRVYELLS